MKLVRSGQTKILHRVVEHSGVLYFAGIVADTNTLNMAGQTTEVIDKFLVLLRESGGTPDSVISATIYITDMALKTELNRAWTERFTADNLPARATIGVDDLGEGYLVEIVFVAAK